MKKIILLLSLLIIFISLQAQDREPTIMKFTYKINGTTFADVPLNRDSIKPKNFVISTQWGGHPKMLHALKFNYTEDKSTTPKPNTDTNNKINYIWQVNTCTHDLVAPGFIYEPTLTIDSLKPDKFNPKLNDTTKAIWGFRKRLGTVTSDTTNINFDRLVLYHDSANSNPSDKVVLSNSWINNKLYYNGNYYYDSTNHGKHLNFGINLRRLDPTEIRDSTNENDTLLIIRLPYKNKITPTVSIQDTIKFSKLPNTSLIDTIHLNYYENLGTALKTHAVSNINNIVILNKMIPDKLRLDSGYKKDITINAEFKCDNDLINNNPMLKVLGENVGLGIDAIDIEVKYYGKHDIAIDWLSVGTQAFRNVFEGKEDSVVHYYAQKMFQTLSDSGYNVNMVYGTDEHPEDYFNSNRRLLRLFNFNSTIEGAGGAHPKQFAYHEEVKNIWDGSPSFVLACGTPFVRKQVFSNPSFKYRLNYGHGFGIDDVIKDTNNSKYETYLRPRVIDSIHSAKIWRDFHTLNIDSISGQEYSDNTIFKGLDYYNAILKVGFSAQALLEINNYNQFYSGNSHIYDHKAWFQNFYFGGDWHPINYVTGERFSYPQYYRPQTGEESRWNIWRALIYGAKGLTYDAHCEFLFKKRNDTIVDYFGGPKTLQFLNNDLYPNIYDTASVETLLFSNNSIFGTDFIQNPDEATGINYGMNFDSTSNVLGVPKNRIYYVNIKCFRSS
ncbi:MAG: hypothetical protein NTW25_16205 [Candidatus Kapabacteria bacterium]|nr:hypothetical protein [Candidatus Kapabacteria bacterium]